MILPVHKAQRMWWQAARRRRVWKCSSACVRTLTDLQQLWCWDTGTNLMFAHAHSFIDLRLGTPVSCWMTESERVMKISCRHELTIRFLRKQIIWTFKNFYQMQPYLRIRKAELQTNRYVLEINPVYSSAIYSNPPLSAVVAKHQVTHKCSIMQWERSL